MNKILTIEQTAKITAKYKREGKTIGFITGCFDILHEGHIDLFRFAKKHVDILVVALDSDKAIKEGKGHDRPIHSISQRAKVLSELVNVDIIVPITEKYSFLKKESVEGVHDRIRDAIKADYITTAPQTDPYWQSKMERAKHAGIEILLFNDSRPISTSKIIKTIRDQ